MERKSLCHHIQTTVVTAEPCPILFTDRHYWASLNFPLYRKWHPSDSTGYSVPSMDFNLHKVGGLLVLFLYVERLMVVTQECVQLLRPEEEVLGACLDLHT